MRFVIISLASFFLIMWSERILLAAFPLCRKGFPHPVKQSQSEKIQDGGEERESYKKKERMRIEREEEGVAFQDTHAQLCADEKALKQELGPLSW